MSQPHLVTPASAGVVTFNTDMRAPLKELKVNVEPVQDLHGYDSPWPAGGGVNKLNANYTETFTTSKDFPISIPNGTQVWIYRDSFTYTTEPSSGVKRPHVVFYNGNTIVGSIWVNPNEKTSFVTLSGDATTFRIFANGFDWTTSKGVEVTIKGLEVSYTEPTAWTPYSNICPISGRTEANVAQTGKNLVNISIENGGATVTKVLEVPIVFPCVVSFKKSADYAESEDVWRICGTLKDGTKKYGFATERSVNIWSEISESNPLISIEIRSTRITAGSITAQLERGSTASDFEDYKGTILSIEFPPSAGIVYGGKLTVNRDGTGALVANRAEADMGTLKWDYASSGGRSIFTSHSLQGLYKNNGSNAFAQNVICECFKNVAMNVTFKNGEFGLDGLVADRIVVCDNRYTDATTFKTAMDGIRLVYELATPLTYTLTAAQVRTLLGTNNVWSDAGDVELSYWTHTP